MNSFLKHFLFVLSVFTTQHLFSAVPSVQASGLTVTNRTNDAISVSWTSGNGNRALVVCKQFSSGTTTPVSGYTNYTANTTFGSGTNLGNANYVIAKTTGTTATVSGLNPNTSYTIYVYEYNFTAASFPFPDLFEYNTSINSSNSETATTLCDEPVTAPSSFTTSAVSYNTATITWTSGSGSYDLVTLDESAYALYYPVDGSTYTANTTWGSGSTLGSDNYVIYNSTGTSVSVSNLKSATSYRARGFAFNCTSDQQNYYTSSYNLYDFTTANYPPTISAISNVSVCQNSAATNVSLSGITDGSTGETQTTSITATSSNTTLIPNSNISISYTSPNTTGTLSFTPATGQSGTSVITVTVNDNFGSTSTTTTTFTVTVNPLPSMTNGTSAAVCSGATLAFNLTSSVPSSYSWLATNNTAITGESTTATTGNPINNTVTNTGTVATNLQYTVTPTSTTGGCVGSPLTVTITVNPRPVMTSASSTSVCSGTALNFGLTSGAAATYAWLAADNTNTTGESTTSQSGASINNTITSSLTTTTNVIYTVTPTGTAGSCVGTAQTVTVTVNPKPVMTSSSTTSVCSGSAMAFALTSGAPSTYSWLATDNASTTGESTLAQSGSTINNTITHSLTSATTVIYTVTPTGTVGACAGNAQTVTVTVNPKPVMTSATTKTICGGNSVALNLTSGASSTYQWLAASNANVTGESTTTQTGSTITNTLTSSNTSTQTVVYTVTPTSTAGSCVGTAQTVTITIDVPVTASAGSDVSLCSSSLNLSGNNPSPATGVWSLISQSTPTFTPTIYFPSTYNSLTGFANFLTGDNATFRWTVTSQLGVCPNATDDVVVTKISCPLTSAFTTTSNSLCIKPGNTTTVTFTDNSSAGAFPPINSYTWTFNGGTPSTATGPGPHVITYSYAATQTTYAASLTVVDNNSNQSTSTQNIVVNPLPSAPGTISGLTTVCQGQSGVNYSVASITNASSYSWVFPSGASSTNPNNIAATNFSNSASSGTIKVAGVNTCGTGDTSTLAITVNPLPGAAGSVNGTSTVCQGQTAVSFSLAAVANATSYQWTLPAGATASGTSNNITIDFGTSAQSGIITVAGLNSCGTGTSNTFSVTVNPLPAAAGSITGSLTACQGQNGVPYSIGALANSTSYQWTMPSGATASGTGNSITADFNTSASSGNISVAGVNACGTGTSSSISVIVNPLPAAAGSISGPSSVCAGSTGVNFSIASVNNATGYNWTFPSGAVSTNPNNIASTDFSTNASSGMITVAGVNACGTGTSSTFNVTVNPLPDAAGTISGTTTVCQGVNGVSFSVPTINNATSYTWTFPSGVSSAGTTNNISADFSTSAQSGQITVVGTNACGNGTSSIFGITVNPLPDAAGTLSGTSPVCQNQTGVAFSVSPILNASSYSWTFSNGASAVSPTDLANVDFNGTATSGLITVMGTNACGNGTSSSFSVTVNTVPNAAGTITGTSTVCAGTIGVSYSIPSILNAGGYNWTFPSGVSSINPNNGATVDFDISAQSGLISVEGVNTCGTGPAATFSVTVNPLPDAAGTISGSSTVCQGQSGVSYSISAVANATDYVWAVPSGASSSSTTENGTVDFSTSAVSGDVIVYAQNACGNGPSSLINVTVNPLPSAPLFSGNLAISNCPLSDSIWFTVPAAANATSYDWMLPAGAYANGSTTDDSISVGFNALSGFDTLYVASVNACGTSSYAYMTVTALALTTPSICMVTVDSLSNFNEIYWDKTPFMSGDTFIVYRDTANNNYAPIGKVPFDSLSMFTDTVRTLYAANGDPNVSSWRYKIAVEDSCGQMSAMSDYHQTMFFQNATGNFSWNHYEIEGQVTPVPALSTYNFKRDDFSTGVWNTIQTLSASSTAYTDPNYTTYQGTGTWRVQTNWSMTCNPTLRTIDPALNVFAIVNTSRSNIKNQFAGPNEITEAKNVETILVYPNPANNMLVIETGSNSNELIEIMDVQGRIVYSTKALNSKTIVSTAQIASGVYVVKTTSAEGKISNRKLVIEH